MAEEQLSKALAVIRENKDLPTNPIRGRLSEAMELALTRLQQLISPDVDEELMRYEPKMARLIGDMSLGIMKLGLQARESDASVRRDQALASLLEEIHQERAAKLINK